MATRRRCSLSDTRAEEHMKLLEQLDTLPLSDSCCDICHCDCYSSHRSEAEAEHEEEAHRISLPWRSPSQRNAVAKPKARASTKSSTAEPKSETTLPNVKALRQDKSKDTTKKAKTKKRSKSVTSQRSLSQCSERRCMRDCGVLQDLLTSLEDKPMPKTDIGAEAKLLTKTSNFTSKNDFYVTGNQLIPSLALEGDRTTIAPVRLSESMANLCLVPTIRDAYYKVPAHDKRILNRMATKRSEQAVAKENAWLARKYWENERYERELLKCEQMEEYKKAVRDKQFQDYLQTRARLNEIAQRDLSELQRLRESLRLKDVRTKKRLQTLRVERDLAVNQKRCEELRKSEHVNINQEEQNLDEMLRKSDICHRLTERLKRADHIRSQMLENYLRRLRYDNYIEQLQHEEHWREVQLNEQLKREQLKEQISRKRCRSQHFVESKRKQNEAVRKTAKLSKSLRDLVRISVTPDTGVTLYGPGTNCDTANITKTIAHTSRMLFEHRPPY